MKEWQYSPTDVCSVGVPNSEKQNIEAKKVEQEKENNNRLDKAKKQFATWIFSFVVSILPLFIIPFARWLDGCGVMDILSKSLSSPEWLFVGTSIAITAATEFYSINGDAHKTVWFYMDFVCILLGMLAYSTSVVFAYCRPNHNYNTTFAIIVTVYLIYSLVLGCIRYIRNIREIKG